jgi:hypothetical protein
MQEFLAVSQICLPLDYIVESEAVRKIEFLIYFGAVSWLLSLLLQYILDLVLFVGIGVLFH